MPSISVANGNVGFTSIQKMWVTDGGVQKPVIEAWVFDAGSFKRIWPVKGTVETLTASLGTIPFKDINLAWDTTFVNSVTINQTAPSQETIASTSVAPYDGSTTITAIPSTTYSFSANVTDTLGTTDTRTATVTTAPVPATRVLTHSFGTLSGSNYPVTLTWTAMSGVTKYQLFNASTNALLQDNITTSNVTRNFSAGTTHRVYVRSVYTAPSGTSYSSENSTTYSFTTPAAGPPAGAYVFRPTDCAVWTTATGWRDQSDLLYHGYYSSNRGTQTSMFFSYEDSSGRGFNNTYYDNATVTKVEVYVYRNTSAGSSTATASRFTQHNHSTFSSGLTPSFGTNYDDSSNPLSYGEAAWITIPNSWGTALLNNTIKGVGWGNVSSGTPAGRYMSGAYTATANVTKATPIGSIRITVG